MTTHVVASSRDSPSATPSSRTGDGNAIVGHHFRVGKKIGEGSFGVVFEGNNILNNAPVAIKFVCSTPSFDREMDADETPGTAQVGCAPAEGRVPQLSDIEWQWSVHPIPFPVLWFNYSHHASTVGIPQVHYFGQEGLHNVCPPTPLISAAPVPGIDFIASFSRAGPRDRPLRPKSRRPLRHVRAEIQHQDSLHARQADGLARAVHSRQESHLPVRRPAFFLHPLLKANYRKGT
jgi:hypothetical protein